MSAPFLPPVWERETHNSPGSLDTKLHTKRASCEGRKRRREDPKRNERSNEEDENATSQRSLNPLNSGVKERPTQSSIYGQGTDWPILQWHRLCHRHDPVNPPPCLLRALLTKLHPVNHPHGQFFFFFPFRATRHMEGDDVALKTDVE